MSHSFWNTPGIVQGVVPGQELAVAHVVAETLPNRVFLNSLVSLIVVLEAVSQTSQLTNFFLLQLSDKHILFLS